MPGESRRCSVPRRSTVLVAVTAAALGAGVAVAATSDLGSSTQAPATSPALAELSSAEVYACPAARKSPARPDAVLNRVFTVQDDAGRRYLLGWTLLPYTGAGDYGLGGSASNLLALQPESGGTPLGYGLGTVVMESDDAGTIDARIELREGGTLEVTGSWSCVSGS